MSEILIPEVVQEIIKQLNASIKDCIKKELFIPSLILIYSGIDTMAWLNRKKKHPYVGRSDFIRWTKDFLLPNSKLSCKAIDLYAARCSIVHSSTAESKLSRKGEASKIFYAWGEKRAKELQLFLDKSSREKIYVIEINDLFNALREGIQRFLDFILKDQEKLRLVSHRAGKLFGKIRPRDFAKKLLNIP